MKTNNIIKSLTYLYSNSTPFGRGWGWVLIFLSTFLPLSAQNSNVLSLQDVNGMRGKVISVPVYLDNTSEIAALQFDITLPPGSQVMYDSTKVADARKADHIISGQNKGSNKHRFMLYSPTNQVLRGNSGKLCDIVFKIYTGLQDDQTYDIKLSNVVMSDRNGANVFTSSTDGILTLTTYPDFEVSGLTITNADITPGGHVAFGWVVSNIGETASTGGWKENFYLVGENNTELFISSNNFENTGIAPGASVSRNIELTLPEVLSIEGAVSLKVAIKGNADSGERSEAEWNNTATVATGSSMTKTIQLVMPTAAVKENNGRNVRLQLNRSGSRTTAETFTLSADKPDRLTLPESVTIGRNQTGTAFYVNIVDDDIYNNDDSVVVITARGAGYADATGRLVIEDNEYADMTLTTSRQEVGEGESFRLTVTLPKAAAKDTEIRFTAETPKRFSMPTSVTIPQGQNSASIDVEVIDNNTPELQLTTAFYATAEKYNKAECLVVVNDNDMPELELVLSPTQISEGAGPTAIMAKLLRRSHADSDIVIVMSDDSQGDIYYSQKRFTMKAGVTTAEFALGVVDNAQKEGDRTVNISAGVYVSSCNCAASGSTIGASSVAVNILDDDGPTLSVTSSSSSLLEGKTDATVLTIRRNTGTTGTTNVSITSDQDSSLSYNHTATIADGQESTTIPVSVLKNEVSNDERTVVFTVTADGYTQGTCWALITDQTMPDATVDAPILAQADVPAAGTTEVTITVNNIGNVDLPAQTKINLYLGSSLLTTLYTQGPIAAGNSENIVKQVSMPNMAGEYLLKAVINEDKSIRELIYINNTSATTPLILTAPFTATVTVDKNIYQGDEDIIIKGVATGNSVANKQVEVYLIHDNVRDTLMTTTDATGKFAVTFNPRGVAGHYAVGACYVGENLRTEQAGFDIYGMRRTDNSYLKAEPQVGIPYSMNIGITNSGSLTLHNISMEVVSSGGNIDVSTQPISSLDGGKRADLPITLIGTEASTGDDWQQLKVRFTSEEGATFDGTIYYYNRTATGKLRASVTNINTTMVKGEQRDYSFDITNTGYGTTGKISLALPEGSWLTAVTGKEMGALESADTTTIVLRFTPTSDMQLNVPVRGSIGINCENGQGLSLPFSIEPVSDAMGVFVVDVCDEYTYYTDEAPHLKDAVVKITHPTTGQLVAEGTTNESGLFMANLPEGWYTLSVSADKHDSYRGNVLVDPGRQTTKVVNLSYQAVTINWEVKETEVEDEYEIVTTTTFETHVPAPVVIIRGPNKIDADAMIVGESQLLYYTVTNEGLIKAANCVFKGPESDSELLFETLANTGPFDLAANQTVIIPVKVTKLSNIPAGAKARTLSPRRAEGSGGRQDNAFTHCMKNLGVLYEILCGKDLKSNSAMLTLAVRFCAAGVTGSVYLGGGGRGPGSPGKGGSGSYYGGGGGYTYLESDDPCDPALSNQKKTLMDSFLSMAPGMGGCIGFGLNAESMAQAAAAGDADGMASAAADFGSSVATTNAPPIAQPFIGFVQAASAMSHAGEAKAFFASKKSNASQGELLERYSWLADYYKVAYWYYRQLECYRNVYINYFGDEAWFSYDDDLRPTFFRKLSSYEHAEDITYENLLPYKPASVTEAQLELFVERLQNTVYQRESENKMDLEYMLNQIALAKYINLYEAPSSQPNHQNNARRKDPADNNEPYYGDDIYPAGEMFVNAVNQVKDDFSDASKTQSVCVTIKLQFKQKLVMTRQAFRGTLTVGNGNEENSMKNVKLMLTVKDEEGNVATAHEFQINNESLDGFTGDLNGEWELAAGQNGTATILFIPTKYAAPTSDKLYSFGGSLSYLDPNTGLTVTRDLDPVTLTVKPSPNLDLTYFMQRDIYGDDPLTKNVVEPIVPAEFALLINNVGYGDATNVRMTTEQPKIIENEKGLMIDFELLSSQLNGGEKTLALGSSVPTDFGTIPALSTSYAQWWFTSTLLGHFLDYNVEATHVTSYGNEDLSLLNNVTIHELIRSINTKAANGQPLKGWLVNDVKDSEDQPDMLYLSDGTTEEVSIATASIRMTSPTTGELTVQPGTKAWNYGSTSDPTAGRQNIVSITRDDGTVVDLRNVWQTDRTMRDGMDPITEYRIHIADKFTVDGQPHTYTITFEPRPNVVLAVESVEGLPKNNELTLTAITTMTVKLNKAVQEFASEHVRLDCQGQKFLQEPTITKMDDLTYQLTYSALEGATGYLVLTVYTSKMTDTEGYTGDNDFKTTWIQFIDGKCMLNMAASPVYGGTVAPGTTSQTYDTDVNITATPAEGFVFNHWTEGDEIISEEAETTYHITTLTSLSTLTAVFTPRHYDVNLSYNEIEGVVRGLGSGKYEYGTTIHLKATPSRFYSFNCWKVNGVEMSTDEEFDITINGDTQIEVLFTYTPPRLTTNYYLAEGWNWISLDPTDATLLDPMVLLAPLGDKVLEIRGKDGSLIFDGNSWTGDLTQLNSGEFYQIHVSEPSMLNIDSRVPEDNVISLKRGWNKVSFNAISELPLTTALTNWDAWENDMIKGQDGFAIYDGSQWTGTLQTMQPGKGYQIYSQTTVSFSYPTSQIEEDVTNVADFEEGTDSPSPAKGLRAPTRITGSLDSYSVPRREYADNMCVVADVMDETGIVNGDRYDIGAFAGADCRGIAELVDGKYYITIYGAAAEDIDYHVFDNNRSEFIDTEGGNIFNVASYCDLSNTTKVLIGDLTSIKSTETTDGGKGLNIYPTIAKERLWIRNEISGTPTITVISTNGTISIKTNSLDADNSLNVSQLANGIYVIILNDRNGSRSRKFIKN